MEVGLFLEEISLYNRIVLGSLLPSAVWDPLPHFLQTWLRSFIGTSLMYLVSGFLWCFYSYHLNRNVFLHKDAIPSRKTMQSQIYVSMKAMPWYTLLPIVSEYMIENGWTRCFPSISDVGWVSYLMEVAVYLVLVELGMYWMHRLQHEIKPLYKYLHATHHMYNKKNTISPFAGMAFHPLDGALQWLPLVIPLFLVPMHFRTHVVILFIEGIWTFNIHGCINGIKIWPLMGSGYHMKHHITYRHNYGNNTILMDWIFGTLRPPVDDR